MTKTNSTINAGVHNGTGIEFQKICALHIIISEYDYYSTQSFFLSIENYDDFIFFHHDINDIIKWTNTFQAKKASKGWTLDAKMHEIIDKILSIGAALKADPTALHQDYSHTLNFITNNTLTLHDGDKKKKTHALLNEATIKLKYSDLDKKIQDNIKRLLKEFNDKSDANFIELDALVFNFIDLPKTYKAQKELLIGLFGSVFGDKVSDHKAAIDTLLSMFRNIELQFNQGNIASLTASEKKISGTHINNAFNIITTKQKAYNFWRAEGKELSQLIKMPIYDQLRYEIQLSNCFDFFKDLTQFEHQKILNFAKEQSTIPNTYYNESNYIEHLHTTYKNTHNSQLSDTEVKFAMIAAYIETRD